MSPKAVLRYPKRLAGTVFLSVFVFLVWAFFFLGFSQGGAMSLQAVLRYPKRLGGTVCLSGWLMMPGMFISHYADVCWRVLTCADVCWRVLTYAEVCWRVLTYADYPDVRWLMMQILSRRGPWLKIKRLLSSGGKKINWNKFFNFSFISFFVRHDVYICI